MAKSNVKVTITGDASSYQRAMGSASKTTDSTRDKMSDFAKTATTALGVMALAAVKQFVASSITAFSDLEQSLGGTEAVFGDASGAIDDFAKTSASSIGMAESEFRTATTLIGGQLKRMTGDVDYAAQQSVILTQTAADLAATYGGTTVEAVEALSAAFRGEADPAERFNLNLKVGAVNAKAVEMGLAQTTSSVDDYAKAQATLALISEQSADAQGQFGREADTVAGQQQRLNAQLENTQALMGEKMAPAWLLAMQQMGKLMIDLADLTGLLGAGEAALMRITLEMGEATDTAEAFATATKSLTDDMSDFWGVQLSSSKGQELWRKEMLLLVDAADLGREELQRLVDSGLTYLMDTLGLTADEAEWLAGVLSGELAKSLTETEERTRAGDMTWQQYGDAAEGAGASTDVVNEALQEASEKLSSAIDLTQQYYDLIDGRMDTLRRLRDANAGVAEAQEAVNEAARIHNEGSPEHLEALDELSIAHQEVRSAQQALVAQGGLTRGEFIQQQVQMGMNIKDAQLLADELDHLFTPRTVHNKIINTITNKEVGGGGGGTVSKAAAQGGRVEGVVRVGENGPELFVPDEPGRILRNGTGEMGTSAGAGGGSIIHITINALDPQSAARAVVEALQTYERSNGAIPINTRPA